MKEFQRIKKSIKSGESKEESGKVIWTNSENGQIIEDIESLSFIEKGSHSFKESYGLKEFYKSHRKTINCIRCTFSSSENNCFNTNKV